MIEDIIEEKASIIDTWAEDETMLDDMDEGREAEIGVISNASFERLDLSNRSTEKTKPSLEEPPTLELKTLPTHLKYAYLGEESTLPVIISSALTIECEKALLDILKNHIKAIGWTLANIRGISPSYCMHKIRLEKGKDGSVERQRRLNPAMKEVVKKEIIK